MKCRIFILAGIMLMMAGCASWFIKPVQKPTAQDYRELNLLKAEEAYNGVMQTLTTLQDTGKISRTTHDAIEPFRSSAWNALVALRAATKDGRDLDATEQITLLNGALDKVKAMLKPPATQPTTQPK